MILASLICYTGDVWDGSNVDDNVLLKDDTDSLALILYEDAFEVANPLGSGKKKHKILAVYMTLGNLLPYCQSGIDHMQLVLLCKEQDFKFFGQDLVFATLVQDLKDLEENGVLLADGKVHKGIQSAIENDRRPSPADRRQMIRILADEMKKHEENPTRSQCLTVTQQIVRRYPKVFADMEFATPSDVQQALPLPESPRLIILGKLS
ncbi:Interferon-induced 44 [Labeo rohita]|uniref:Interferon-induced 44 n=1 Tax=Labeo rohita TaxID=84645 RepID=A0A498NZC4_LABRO|nr:Interferon-induced 44 [Labeo rohita]